MLLFQSGNFFLPPISLLNFWFSFRISSISSFIFTFIFSNFSSIFSISLPIFLSTSDYLAVFLLAPNTSSSSSSCLLVLPSPVFFLFFFSSWDTFFAHRLGVCLLDVTVFLFIVFFSSFGCFPSPHSPHSLSTLLFSPLPLHFLPRVAKSVCNIEQNKNTPDASSPFATQARIPVL
jgi:hypothetical protein